MGAKLLPYPFRGGEARLQRKGKKHGYYVIFKKCGCRTPYYQFQFLSDEELRDTAIKTWNTRKLMEQIVEKLEQEKIININSDETHAKTWNNAIQSAVDCIRNSGKADVPEINVGNNGWIPVNKKITGCWNNGAMLLEKD